MRAQVVFPERCVRLEPGGHIRREVLVRNLGLTTDRFTFEVVGVAASWTTLDPPVLTLGPEATGHVVMHFRPPRSAHVRAGVVPFGLLTTSTQESACSVVEQMLEVGRFTDTVVELIPRCVRRVSATFRLTVANRGNDTVRVCVRGRDPANALRVECTPARLTVFPGTTAQSGIRVRPARRPWRGTPISRPFQIVVDPGEDTPLLVGGELVLRPMLL